MARFTLPRDLYHGKGSIEILKTLKGERAVVPGRMHGFEDFYSEGRLCGAAERTRI